MAKRKDKAHLLGSLRLSSSRKPYYFQVYLWDSIDHLRDHFEVADETLAMTCFEPWYIDDDTGNVYINPKLGEIHYAKDHWNINVIAHEVQHAVVHRMRLIWPPAHLILLDEYADAEEEIAYETGHWVERVHTFLWGLDPGPHTNPIIARNKFNLPHFVSKVRFPKSGVKLAKRKAPPTEGTGD